MIHLIVMAAPRTGTNWHSTIAAASRAGFEGPITVCFDAEDVTLPEKALYAHLDVDLKLLSAEEAAKQALRPPNARAVYTAMRCLRSGRSDCLNVVVEDDVTFRHGWTAAVERANAAHPGILLGYSRITRDGEDGVVRSDEREDATLLVAWPYELMVPASGCLEYHLRTSLRPAADSDLTIWWIDNKVPRYYLVPSVVQHLGDDALINPKHGVRRTPMWG